MLNSVADKRIWIALAPAMTLPFAASLFYFVLFSDKAFAKWIYSGTKIFTLVWPLLCMGWWGAGKGWNIRSHPSRHWPAIAIGAASGMVIVLTMFGLMQTPVGEVVRAGAPRIRAKAEGLGFLNYYWAFALFLSLLHSLLEEYYWRWFVFGRLRTVVPRATAHILAGVAFAAHHIVVTTQFFPFGWGLAFGVFVGVGGMIWSYLYERQKTLLGAWISHLLVDLGIMSIGHKLLFGTYL